MVISSLDEVAWLLNVRGDDIPYNPFVVSYVILTMDEAKWLARTLGGDGRTRT